MVSEPVCRGSSSSFALIVPLNPVRWFVFIAGSAIASDMPEFGDKIQTPFDNLVVAKEFLETYKSDVQWRD